MYVYIALSLEVDSANQPTTNSILSATKTQNSESVASSAKTQKTQSSESMASSAKTLKTQNSQSVDFPEKTQKSPLARLYKKFSRKKSEPGKSQTRVEETRKSSCSSSNGSSEISVEELRAVFDYMDANSDGRVSAAELQRCLGLLGGALSSRDAEEAVRMMDSDGDGFMDFGEFLRLMEGEGESCYGEEERRRELREAFGMYATEGDEFITAASLRRTLSRLGESRSVDDCKGMIRVFDKNGDGVLSFDEFVLMMR